MRKIMKKGYKVVREEDVGLLSAVTQSCSEAIVQYKKGKRASPKPLCGPLAVFTKLIYAKVFVNGLKLPPMNYEISCDKHEIWECEYEGANVKALWNTEYRLTKFPLGTDLAKWVKITKRVGRY